MLSGLRWTLAPGPEALYLISRKAVFQLLLWSGVGSGCLVNSLWVMILGKSASGYPPGLGLLLQRHSLLSEPCLGVGVALGCPGRVWVGPTRGRVFKELQNQREQGLSAGPS